MNNTVPTNPEIRMHSSPEAPRELSEFIGELVLSTKETCCYYAILPSYRDVNVAVLARQLETMGKSVFRLNFRHPEKSPFGYDPVSCCLSVEDASNLAQWMMTVDEDLDGEDSILRDLSAEILGAIIASSESVDEMIRMFYTVKLIDWDTDKNTKRKDFLDMAERFSPTTLKTWLKLKDHLGTASRESIFALITEVIQKTFVGKSLRMMEAGTEGFLKPTLFYPDFVYLIQVPEDDPAVHRLVSIFCKQLCASMEQAGSISTFEEMETIDDDDDANELIAFIPANW